MGTIRLVATSLLISVSSCGPEPVLGGDLCFEAGVQDADRALVMSAVEQWSVATGGRVMFRESGSGCDVRVGNVQLPGTELGQQQYKWSTGYRIALDLPKIHGGAWTASQATAIDLEIQVVIHEFGHLFGLDHFGANETEGGVMGATGMGLCPCVDSHAQRTFCDLHGCNALARPTCPPR